ncbi:class A beta-lactamase [Streptomyces sp. NPDC057638]|uniref:class A beta-lactamase n=1 Tax=Streptomyces sp. NPDC057638 TaxID=3346190 RepID=UPI00368E9F73
MPGTRATRRSVLALGTGAALALGTGAAVAAEPRRSPRDPLGDRSAEHRLRELEREHGVLLGVYARNTVTGRTVAYRADRPFPLCSVFKTYAAAAVLDRLDHDGRFLAQRRFYTAEFVEESGGGAITQDNVATGMTVGELCSATISYSDNAAANLLLRDLGGPTSVTRFCRGLGDPHTRLDRWEPDLNSADPWRAEDTTTPRASARNYARLVLGDVLDPADRELLTGWLLANTTSTHRMRAGIPAHWPLGDKTGAGRYGTNNDVGIAWAPGGRPLVLSIFSTKDTEAAPRDDAAVRKAATLLAETLTQD